MRGLAIISCILCASISTLATPSSKRETIVGQVIAYSSSLACLNGITDWSMLIRAQHSKAIPKFLRVNFALPCRQSPRWVLDKPSIQKFFLSRQRACDEALVGSLAGFIEGAKNQDLAIPIWQYPPGSEHDKLPFGIVLPCYRPADQPAMPIL